MSRDRWVCLWLVGIYSGLRAEIRKQCALEFIGTKNHAEKKFLAIEVSVRKPTHRWW